MTILLTDDIIALLDRRNAEVTALRTDNAKLHGQPEQHRDDCPCRMDANTTQVIYSLRSALEDIVRRYEFRSELYIDDATCAGSLYDTARLVLSKKEML